MKPTKAQIAIAYAASALLMLGVFHEPLGLSETWGIIFPLAAIVCMIAFFTLRRRQKAHGSNTQEISSAVPAAKQKNIRRLSLFLMIVVSLSGPWWLPYTGTKLPFPQMVVVAIITCITSVTIYLIASRRTRQRSNQAMQRTAPRYDA
ncbi:MAG TPA: hypothetical protein VGQ70_05320 [Candidatus Udaeobacter sp.]|jgi:preprotein translocase subunit YajC|nr:hypothetical protein [Candidatus Udaeobacter sp.]